MRALALALVLVALPSAARADGAFADSQRLFLPPERPEQLVLATNFGLVSSDDGGHRWTWTCEQPEAPDATAYQLGPAPRRRLFAIARAAAAYSDDLGCSWATGALPGDARALDVFPDPSDPDRVYASAALGSASEQRTVLLTSRDGGQTFPTVLYEPPAGAVILGVESARSSDTLYLSLRQSPGTHPRVARSDDRGQSWQLFDVEEVTGAFDLGIIAVEASDPRTLYLRVRAFPDEALAISRDGGANVRLAARIPRGVLTAFGRRADGTLLVAGANLGGGVVLGSRDGADWTPWMNAPLARDFGERAGTLYVVGDDARDQFAVATGDGAGLQRLMGFADVSSVRACAVSSCAAACRVEAARGTFPATVCETPPLPPADAGAPAPDAAADVPPVAPARPRSGGCSVGGQPAAPVVVLLATAMTLVPARKSWKQRRPFPKMKRPSTR